MLTFLFYSSHEDAIDRPRLRYLSNGVYGATISHTPTFNTLPAIVESRPLKVPQTGISGGQGVPAPVSKLGSITYYDTSQLFASQNIVQRPPPPLHPYIRQSLAQGLQQGASSSFSRLGRDTAVPATRMGERLAALVPSSPRGHQDAGHAWFDTSNRLTKSPQAPPKLIEGNSTAVEQESGPPGEEKKYKNEFGELVAWIHRKYIIPNFPVRGKNSKVRAACEFCQKTVHVRYLPVHMLSWHLQEFERSLPENIRPRFYNCTYPGCGALEKNYRPHALYDHKARVHGIDTPKNRYSIDRTVLRRKSHHVLQNHNLIDGRELNSLKKGVREAEQQLAERFPHYRSRHGLDLDTTYPTVKRALDGKSAVTLTNDLIKLRKDGSMNGSLLCRPGQKGSWKEVLEDLETALARAQEGLAFDDGEEEDDEED